MTDHPYPKRVVEAVASTLAVQHGYTLPYSDLNSRHKNLLDSSAQSILQALWDASRVEHPGQVESIPGDTILTTPDNRAVSAQTMQWVVRPADYPAHVIFWGDHDDR